MDEVEQLIRRHEAFRKAATHGRTLQLFTSSYHSKRDQPTKPKGQGYPVLLLEGQCLAEFSSNWQTHLLGSFELF